MLVKCFWLNPNGDVAACDEFARVHDTGVALGVLRRSYAFKAAEDAGRVSVVRGDGESSIFVKAG